MNFRNDIINVYLLTVIFRKELMKVLFGWFGLV